MQVTRSTPVGGSTALTELFYAAIAGVRERLWVTTAYFAPDRTFENVLCAAARRGVDVRTLVNGHRVDKEVARQAGRAYGRCSRPVHECTGRPVRRHARRRTRV